MPFYERQPYIQALYLIITEVMNGDIRIPKFQRAGTQSTWTPEQRGDLLDSLYRGYPIGTILLWSASDRKIQTIDRVGGYAVPELSKQHESMRLLLDGHQRLSTLVKILGAGLSNRTGQVPDEFENWVFDLNENPKIDSRDCFVLLKPGKEPTDFQLPLSIILSRSELNKWIRNNQNLSDNQIQEADNLRDRLREYNFPVAVLGSDSLQEATTSFKRINSSGTPMSDYDMVAALAYDADFDFRDKFDQAREEYLGDYRHWNEVSDSDVLRVCTGLLGADPSKINVDSIAKNISRNNTLIDESYENIAKAIQILINFGITGPAALPYSWQLITLAIFIFNENDNFDFSSQDVKNIVRKWFWLTSYGEVFAGINSATYKRSSKALLDMLKGKGFEAMERDLTRKITATKRFDFRAARSKACALNMARVFDGSETGEAHDTLAEGKSAMQVLWGSGMRSNWKDLGVIPNSLSLNLVKSAITKKVDNMLLNDAESAHINKLGISNEITYRDTQDLIEKRANSLLDKERKFVEELGLEWVPSRRE